MIPSILPETTINPFKFYGEGEIQEAVFIDKTFYKYVETFSSDRQKEVYALSFALSGQGYATLISTTGTEYKVWVDIRCADPYQALLPKLVSKTVT
ncbi:MAG: hypothetical protein F6K16_29975 [Symploca sp. SIO2B6]|nr:hypothetical protein [Symploca sp. SIO2B6]